MLKGHANFVASAVFVLAVGQCVAAGAPGDLLRVFENPTPDAGDRFGYCMAAVGDNVLIGAPDDSTYATRAGAAYLFDGWTGELLRAFRSPTPDYGESFGWSVASVGGNVLIGDPADDGTGAAFLFDASTGALLATFRKPTPALYDSFGGCVAALGNNVLIADVSDDTGAQNAGAVYLFEGVGLHVAIDIKPGSEDNPLNVLANGLLPVAVLGSETFDVSQIDQATLSLAGAGPEERGKSGNYGALEDVNGDGLPDLVVHFPVPDLALQPGDHAAVLTGKMLDGASFVGVDLVRILVPGDANNDGLTNLADFAILKSNFGLGGKLPDGDFNEDGLVNLADFNILKAYFGTGGPAGTGIPLPEPGAITILALGGAAMLRQKRRRSG